MTSVAYLRGPRRPDGAASRGTESRRGDREEHETRLPAQQPTSAPASLCVFLLFLPVCAAHRQSQHRDTHARVHTRTRTQPHAPPPGTHVSHSLASSYGQRFLFSPFSFLIICLLLPSLFQYPLSFSRLHMQSASPHSPHLLSLSLPPFPSLSRSLSLHLLSSLSSVCAEREAII